MIPDASLMKAVESLNYRMTTGDVASQAGLDIKQAERGLLALASEAGGHLQVSDTGEVVYLFPRNFRAILRSKSLRLRLQELWQRVWRVLFYLIRISFGILLILSLVIIVVALIALYVVSSQSNRDSEGRSRGGGMPSSFFPYFWLRASMFDVFQMDYYRRRRYSSSGWNRGNSRTSASDGDRMSFLEAVFSFLFGDGDPNADLSDRRWQQLAGVIRNNGGAVAAEQLAPYLELDDARSDDEDYVLPVLLRFNGRPEVSPEGGIVYHFPELQVMAEQRGKQSVPDYLRERIWPFSEASSNQLMVAGGLGIANIVGAVVLGQALADPALDPMLRLGGSIGFIDIGYGVLLAYAIAFVTIPLVRYGWLKQKNQRIEHRNEQRRERANRLDHPSPELQHKIDYAHQFAAETVVTAADLAYTTETGLTEQEFAQSDKIDEEWRRRFK